MSTARIFRRESGSLRRLGKVNLAQAGGALPVAPPAVTYTDVHVSNASLGSPDVRELILTPGVDYNVIFDEVMPRRVRVIGGRHVKIIGAEFDINFEQIRPAFAADIAARYDNNCCLEFSGQTGTVFIEGLWCHGAYANDSIRATNVPTANIVVQNCRLEVDRIQTGLSDTPDGFSHSDGFQCFLSGLRSLVMYNVTIYNPYQGGMFGDGTPGLVWGPTLISRVNMRPGATVGQAQKMFNLIGNSTAPFGPVTMEDVYYQIGTGTQWSNSFAPPMVPPYTGGAFYSTTTIGTDEYGRQYGQPIVDQIPGLVGCNDGLGGPGRVYRGLPPTGDYVAAGGTASGIGYVSPGYVT